MTGCGGEALSIDRPFHYYGTNVDNLCMSNNAFLIPLSAGTYVTTCSN